MQYARADYSVVVKNRAPPPKAWRWEIYRAGNANPLKRSSIYFETTAAAKRAGKDALKELLNKLLHLTNSAWSIVSKRKDPSIKRRHLDSGIALRRHRP